VEKFPLRYTLHIVKIISINLFFITGKYGKESLNKQAYIQEIYQEFLKRLKFDILDFRCKRVISKTYIRGLGVKIVYVLRMCIRDTRIYAHRTGNAINVGAMRGRIDIDTLLIISFEIFLVTHAPT
jgi:hypothetical protein